MLSNIPFAYSFTTLWVTGLTLIVLVIYTVILAVASEFKKQDEYGINDFEQDDFYKNN